MCNNGVISGVRCGNAEGESLQKVRHFNHKTDEKPADPLGY